MDGSLLTMNMLLAALRRQAMRDLGLLASPDQDDKPKTREQCDRDAKDVSQLMVRMAAQGLEDVIRSSAFADMDVVKGFVELVGIYLDQQPDRGNGRVVVGLRFGVIKGGKDE